VSVFTFVILIILISTVGKVIAGRQYPRMPPPPPPSPSLPPGEAEELRDTIDRLEDRLSRLEQERDFYRDLLDDPRRKQGLPPSQWDTDGE
jgi:hypothetical protein